MSIKHHAVAALFLTAAACLPACKQTRPIPGYHPMLVMETNSPSYVHRFDAQGPLTATPGAKGKGGG